MLKEPACFRRGCVFFKGVEQPDGTEMTERNVCFAFPEGIPDDIQSGENLHNESVDGDSGIQYYGPENWSLEYEKWWKFLMSMEISPVEAREMMAKSFLQQEIE